MEPPRFADRRAAGRRLAELLRSYAGRSDVVVLGLPRGGVPVAYEVARALGVRLDAVLVRKLGVPDCEELAMGAVASGGARVLNDEVVRQLAIPERVIDAVAAREMEELARRERLYRGGRAPCEMRDRVVVLIDDGFATGATMRAAIRALRQAGPARIVAAAPTGAFDTCEKLKKTADEVVCAITPEPFFAVGRWYLDFGQTTDVEVCGLLARARGETAK